MAGIARESVNRILSDWKHRKLVTQLSGYYCIENKAHLLNEAHLAGAHAGVRIRKSANSR